MRARNTVHGESDAPASSVAAPVMACGARVFVALSINALAKAALGRSERGHPRRLPHHGLGRIRHADRAMQVISLVGPSDAHTASGPATYHVCGVAVSCRRRATNSDAIDHGHGPIHLRPGLERRRDLGLGKPDVLPCRRPRRRRFGDDVAHPVVHVLDGVVFGCAFGCPQASGARRPRVGAHPLDELLATVLPEAGHERRTCRCRPGYPGTRPSSAGWPCCRCSRRVVSGAFGCPQASGACPAGS